ncbi:MAG: hypothetical protein V3S56_05555, partial [Gemmatimonadota bacterium]
RRGVQDAGAQCIEQSGTRVSRDHNGKILADRGAVWLCVDSGHQVPQSPGGRVMASEIRRTSDGKVVAVGGNAIRDGERYLIAILLPSSGHEFKKCDIGAVYDVRDTAMFLGHSVQLRLTALPAGDLEMAEFRPVPSPENDSLTNHAA